MDIEKLRFPIGTYQPGEIKPMNLPAWIEDIKNLPSQINTILEGIREEELNYTYRPEGWSVRQLIHHLADSHMNAFIRFKLALTEDNPVIKPYFEAEWARMDDVKLVPITASLSILEGVHARLSCLLSEMSIQEYSRTYTHPEHGKQFDVAYTIGMYSWHGRHHLEHIKNALAMKRAFWN